MTSVPQRQVQLSVGRLVPASIWILAVAVLGTLAINACESTSTVASPNTTAVAGSYGLVTVNDSALPRTVTKGANYLLQIVDDTIQLSTVGTWADLTHYVETSGNAVGYPFNLIVGTFTVTGSTINFLTSTGNHFTGLVTANSLQITGTTRALYVK